MDDEWKVALNMIYCPHKGERINGMGGKSHHIRCHHPDVAVACNYKLCPMRPKKSDMSEKKEEEDGKPRIVCA